MLEWGESGVKAREITVACVRRKLVVGGGMNRRMQLLDRKKKARDDVVRCEGKAAVFT